KPRIVWRNLARRARLADRARQRHLTIRHELLEVLKAKVLVVGGIGRRSYGPLARDKLWISRVRDRRGGGFWRGIAVRRGWLRIFSWIGIAGIAVADHLAGRDGRAVYDMAEPRGPRPVVGDTSEGGNHVPIAGRLGLVEDGLVEARTPTPRLVHDERRQIVAHGVGMPALLAI